MEGLRSRADRGSPLPVLLILPDAGGGLDKSNHHILVELVAEEISPERVREVVAAPRYPWPMSCEQRAGSDECDPPPQLPRLYNGRLALALEGAGFPGGMPARGPDGLRPRPAQLDEHRLVPARAPILRRLRIAAVDTVRPWLARSAEHERRLRQEGIRARERFRCVEVYIHDATARRTVQDAEVRSVRGNLR
jgi:hypothetical protein